MSRQEISSTYPAYLTIPPGPTSGPTNLAHVENTYSYFTVSFLPPAQTFLSQFSAYAVAVDYPYPKLVGSVGTLGDGFVADGNYIAKFGNGSASGQPAPPSGYYPGTPTGQIVVANCRYLVYIRAVNASGIFDSSPLPCQTDGFGVPSVITATSNVAVLSQPPTSVVVKFAPTTVVAPDYALANVGYIATLTGTGGPFTGVVNGRASAPTDGSLGYCSASFTGLTPTATYTFTVQGSNAAGAGSTSTGVALSAQPASTAAGNPVLGTPATSQTSISYLTVSGCAQAASLAATATSVVGSNVTTGVCVLPTPGSSNGSIVFSGLTPATSYLVSAQASNAVGVSSNVTSTLSTDGLPPSLVGTSNITFNAASTPTNIIINWKQPAATTSTVTPTSYFAELAWDAFPGQQQTVVVLDNIAAVAVGNSVTATFPSTLLPVPLPDTLPTISITSKANGYTTQTPDFKFYVGATPWSATAIVWKGGLPNPNTTGDAEVWGMGPASYGGNSTQFGASTITVPSQSVSASVTQSITSTTSYQLATPSLPGGRYTIYPRVTHGASAATSLQSALYSIGPAVIIQN